MSELSQGDLLALQDCARFPEGVYIWRGKTMQRLAKQGFVEACGKRDGKMAWRLTDAGRAAIAGVQHRKAS